LAGAKAYAWSMVEIVAVQNTQWVFIAEEQLILQGKFLLPVSGIIVTIIRRPTVTESFFFIST
jgi:hypothetical protein